MGKYPIPTSLIVATLGKQADEVNALANEGKLKPVSFVMSDGIERHANSCWAATDWLKSNDYYDDLNEPPVEWRF